MSKFLVFINLLLAGVLYLNWVNAQEDERNIRFGLQAAPTVAWLKPEAPTVSAGGLSTRFIYGLVFDYRFANNFWFGTGLDISYLGGSFSYRAPCEINNKVFPDLDGGYSPITSSRYTVQFLELPLTVKMKTNEINNIKYFAQVGLNPGFRLDCKAKHEILGPKQSKVKAIEDVNLMRLAVNISGGVEYNLTGTTSLLLGINYNNGFTNLFKKISPNVRQINNSQLVRLNMRSNYIALNVGFLF